MQRPMGGPSLNVYKAQWNIACGLPQTDHTTTNAAAPINIVYVKDGALKQSSQLSVYAMTFAGRQRMQIVLLCLSILIFEWICYVLAVEPVYRYAGFTITFSIAKMLEAGICVIAVGLFLPCRVRQPSDFFNHLLFIFPVSAMSVLYFAQDAPRLFYYLSVACFFIVLITTRLASFDRLRLPPASPNIGLFVLGSLLAIGLVNLIVSGAWRYFNLEIFHVYETRSATNEIVGGGAFGYLSPWAFEIAGPWLFMISMAKRKYVVAIVLFLTQLFIYGSTGYKSFLGIVLFMLIMYYYVLSRNCLKRLYVLILSIIGIAILEWQIIGSNFFSGVIVRREFFVPALLNYAYYLMAEQYGYVWWSDSFLRFFDPYTWSVGTAEMASYFMWGHVNIHANTGFLGAGYLDAGAFGMVIYSVILGLLLRICDRAIVSRISSRFAMAVVSPSLMTVFDSSDLLTALFTHGVGLLLVILWLLGGTDKGHANAPLVPDHKVLRSARGG